MRSASGSEQAHSESDKNILGQLIGSEVGGEIWCTRSVCSAKV